MIKGVLRGRNILVTSGSTRAPIDAVRFISNRSTGQLATEIALECIRRGADVTFLHGVGSETPLTKISSSRKNQLDLVTAETFDDVYELMPRLVGSQRFDAIFHAMAVLDYLPTEPIPGKIKSGRRELILKLAPSPKILPMLRKMVGDVFLVAFKLEVGVKPAELWSRAHKLIENAGADVVVANLMPLGAPENHSAYIIRPDYSDQLYPPEEIVGKKEIAWSVVEEATTALMD